jgi:hypothetical protein
VDVTSALFFISFIVVSVALVILPHCDEGRLLLTAANGLEQMYYGG